MLENIIKINSDSFKGIAGDALYIDLIKIRESFDYCGIWYVRDKSQESVITTELYFSANDKRPIEQSVELKENSFQQANRHRISTDHNHVWIAARTSETSYGKMKLFDFKKENAFINYKIIKNKAHGADALASGVFRGGQAYFAKLGIEDMMGALDYEDTIFYLVFIKNPPPADWGVDSFLGVEGVPILVPPCKFTADGNYSNWNDQNPLDGIR